MTADIWFRTGMSLSSVAAVVGATVTHEDVEDYWEWVLADLDGVIIDITRTHTVPAARTDTRIFRFDNEPFTRDLLRLIVDRLAAAGIPVAETGTPSSQGDS